MLVWILLVLRGVGAQRLCGDCFCIPGADGVCPSEVPKTDFSDLVPALRSFVDTTPFSIDCDPYLNETCTTSPPQGTTGVCVLDIPDECPGNYSTYTFEGTLEEALARNLPVTHASPCGACSSLQDLAVYMEIGSELRQSSTQCGFRGVINADDGVECFRELGFSESCAQIWFFNTRQTSTQCGSLCAPFALSGDPPNGPAPECALAECLECDETQSGPVFSRVSGRTRRNSGLLSDIVRGCDEIVYLDQIDPCLIVNPPEPTASGAAVISLVMLTTLVNVLLLF